MSRTPDSAKHRTDLLSKAAKALPDVGEGVACAGTSIESKTFTVNGKAFLFVGSKNLRLKLANSASEADRFAKHPSSAVQMGAGGWTTIRLADGTVPEDAVLRRWVAESHALFHRPPARLAAVKLNGTAPAKAAAPRRRSS